VQQSSNAVLRRIPYNAPQCARSLSAAVRCHVRHCAAVAEMLTGIAALATSPVAAQCVKFTLC
jgi:hypothetical protein